MQGSARKDVVFGAAPVDTVTVPGPKWKSWFKSMRQLTDAQAQLLAALRRRVEDGEPLASYRELCTEFEWTSTGTVRDHLRALARKGYVQLPGSRGGRVRLREFAQVRSIPIVGRVAAGVPRVADENIEGLLPIPADWTRNGDFFALRVTGDSMKDAGVLEGDHVIVHWQAVAASGEIVVATIDGETTLKRLIMRGAQTFLVPENSAYEPIEVKTESALIHGVVAGLLRAYRRDHAWKNPLDLADLRYRQEEEHAHRT